MLESLPCLSLRVSHLVQDGSHLDGPMAWYYIWQSHISMLVWGTVLFCCSRLTLHSFIMYFCSRSIYIWVKACKFRLNAYGYELLLDRGLQKNKISSLVSRYLCSLYLDLLLKTLCHPLSYLKALKLPSPSRTVVISSPVITWGGEMHIMGRGFNAYHREKKAALFVQEPMLLLKRGEGYTYTQVCATHYRKNHKDSFNNKSKWSVNCKIILSLLYKNIPPPLSKCTAVNYYESLWAMEAGCNAFELHLNGVPPWGESFLKGNEKEEKVKIKVTGEKRNIAKPQGTGQKSSHPLETFKWKRLRHSQTKGVWVWKPTGLPQL